jgi:hypothetical protein
MAKWTGNNSWRGSTLKIAEKIRKRKRGDTEAEAANRLQAGDPVGQDGASA